jgi:hypothetical protein
MTKLLFGASCSTLGRLCSSDPPAQLSEELHDVSGSWRVGLTGGAWKYWSKRHVPGVTLHDPVLGMTGGKFTVSRLALVFAAPRYQVIKKGVANPPDFGLENQGLFLAETLII